jgi:hypothetical protein
MKNQKLIITSLVNSLLAVLYVSVVVFIMNNSKNLFDKTPEVVIGVAMLMLFVTSATVMGFLILGRPLLMYFDGAKKEAVKLFYFTIAWLVLIVITIFSSIAIF